MDTWQEALNQFVERDFRDWHGLPGDDSLANIRHYFSVFSDDIGQATLGQEKCYFLMLPVTGYDGSVRAWYTPDSKKVLLLDGSYPELSPDLASLLGALGEPAAKLDTYWGTLPVAQGEWVYPDRGLTLFLSEEDNAIYHLAVFAPISLAYYQENLRLPLRKRRTPTRF